ncbi:carbohydrate ABC transporter permease [Priestia megaterium]|uniref:carbohydrate ABC transporter permease n=1 Tax=Priestia megaterium TaxID=1404 RepID=UPI00272F19C9|nr:carbohydrate ABC transporter permease [Priestia megaterium]MDP1442155.1 carbohydrate ABC transporter permease [Priestia megaterium]MDP1471255.1 carbohydrate ABC transporter permease [Priestia megaterium]
METVIKNKFNKKSKLQKSWKDRIFDISVYGIAVMMILMIIYPLWFIVIASFSNPADVSNGNVLFWPKEWKLDGYIELIKQKMIWRGYLNTIMYTLVGTFIALMVNIPAGYALSRKELFGRRYLSVFYIIPMFISGGLVPTYLVVKNFGLLDTFWVMVLPFAVSAFNIIIARTFFKTSIPDSLWEAAQIDGCGTIRYFLTMVLPLSKAILAVIGLWTAVDLWNSWFNAMIYLSNENLQPLQLILRRILIANESILGTSSGELASELRRLSEMMKYAAIVVSTLPIMCLYPFLQKYFNQGVMVGSIKE